MIRANAAPVNERRSRANQIAEISNFYNDDYDVIVSVDSETWKGIILKTENAARAITSGKLRIDGESIKFLQFSALFVND